MTQIPLYVNIPTLLTKSEPFSGNSVEIISLVCKRILFGLIFLAPIIAHIRVISNPGFYNHDEWQNMTTSRIWFPQFCCRLWKNKSGARFGYPMRPVSFLEQGFASINMMDLPWVSHLIDLSIHLSSGLLFYFLLLQLPRIVIFNCCALVHF